MNRQPHHSRTLRPVAPGRGKGKERAMKPVVVVVLAVLALVPVILAATAGATAPGRNGEVAFRRYFDAQKSRGAVFTVGADGSRLRQVTHPKPSVVDNYPRWAPDGSLIIFTRCAGDGIHCHLWVVGADGSALAPVGRLCPAGANEQSCPDDSNGSFSPDSKRIAFQQATGRVSTDANGERWIEHSALTLINPDGSGRHVIYQSPAFSSDLNAPSFSPNGKQLVFDRQVSGFSKPAGKHAVYVIDVNGSHLRRLTPWDDNDGDHTDWSPDGKWILFHSRLDDPAAQSQIILIHPDGSGRKQLTHFPPGTTVGRSGFSPDGTSIVLAKGPVGGNVDVFTMRLDGSQLRRLTRSPLWESAPDWGPAP